MNRYLIHVSTNWCGMDDTFRATANSEEELWDIAEELAYDVFIPIDIPNKEFYYELNCSWFHPGSYLEKIYNKK